ncbi:MAG: hypothetical protein PHH04_03310 [Thomasclavelia sp.]|nr:hypothetical protein [Thomasclavelia sp.]
MKKIIICLSICLTIITGSLTNISASTTIDNSYNKLVAYYESKTSASRDDIIAMEAIGVQADSKANLDFLENDFSTAGINDLSKAILASIFVGKDPTNINNQNLVTLLENYISDDGKLMDGEYECYESYYPWTIYALYAVNSSKVELLASRLASLQKEDGSFGGFSGSLDLDTTTWCLEALSLVDKTKYSSNINKTKDLLATHLDTTTNTYTSSWGANSNTHAACLEALVVNDRNLVNDESYNKTVEALTAYQTTTGSFKWKVDSANDSSFSTQDAARCLGAYKNGCFATIAKEAYQKLTNKETPVTNPSVNVPTNQNSNSSPKEAVLSAKTSDNQEYDIYLLSLIIMGAVIIRLVSKHEKTN